MKVGARTRVLALLGDPVAHSLSPRMQNAAFAALGLDAVYVALRTEAGQVGAMMRSLAAAGGGGNVTVPHKAEAARAVSVLHGPVPGACNTFWAEGGAVEGANTDVDGILGALHRLGAAGRNWLVIGTGGSAQAVAVAAHQTGASLAVRSRDPARGARFLAACRELGVAEAEVAECQVVINATPLGLRPSDPLPVEPAAAPTAQWALDLVYARGETAWIRAMRARGVDAMDGREVLVRQGAAALERWFPGRRAPLEVMRAAVRAGLD